MRRNLKCLSLWLLTCLSFPVVERSQADPQASSVPAEKPKPYVVAHARLDTQWRWEYPTAIGEYIPNTVRDNLLLFEKYPHYIWNFSGTCAAGAYGRRAAACDFRICRASVKEGGITAISPPRTGASRVRLRARVQVHNCSRAARSMTL